MSKIKKRRRKQAERDRKATLYGKNNPINVKPKSKRLVTHARTRMKEGEMFGLMALAKMMMVKR